MTQQAQADMSPCDACVDRARDLCFESGRDPVAEKERDSGENQYERGDGDANDENDLAKRAHDGWVRRFIQTKRRDSTTSRF